jgi:hypothetical protein
MTVRDVAAAVIRLVGLYLAGRVIALTASLLAMPFLISPAAFNSGDALLAASLGSTVGNAVLAAIALTMADAIAAASFRDTPISWALRRRDVLVVGIALIGLWCAADAAVALARAGAAAIHYARLDVPRESLERSWPMLVVHATTLITGVGAARVAARLARWVEGWHARSARPS